MIFATDIKINKIKKIKKCNKSSFFNLSIFLDLLKEKNPKNKKK